MLAVHVVALHYEERVPLSFAFPVRARPVREWLVQSSQSAHRSARLSVAIPDMIVFHGCLLSMWCAIVASARFERIQKYTVERP